MDLGMLPVQQQCNVVTHLPTHGEDDTTQTLSVVDVEDRLQCYVL
jgi:hypothetical protein